MKIESVMDEVGAAGRLIPGMQVHPWEEERVTPPCLLISLPSNYRFDTTYDRGLDEFDLTITALVSRVGGGQTQRDAITRYMDGTGPYSVKRALERYAYTSLDVLKVRSVTALRVKIAGTTYLGAVFTAHIAGQGG